MKILNPLLRRSFAEPGLCELCGKSCTRREGHHLWTCTPEITIRINLISVGSSQYFQCRCHSLAHNGKIPRNAVIERVAMRERCCPEDLVIVMEFLRRTIKPTRTQLEAALSSLPVGAFILAKRELTEAKKL